MTRHTDGQIRWLQRGRANHATLPLDGLGAYYTIDRWNGEWVISFLPRGVPATPGERESVPWLSGRRSLTRAKAAVAAHHEASRSRTNGLATGDGRSDSDRVRIRLGGYPAKQCPRRTHNRYAPASPEPTPPTPVVSALWAAGRQFEAHIVDELRACLPSDRAHLVVLEEGDNWDDNRRRTVEAMTAGVEVIVGGRLPDIGDRAGAPDVLVRHREGYLPVDIKNHQSLAKISGARSRGGVVVSSLAAPDRRQVCAARRNTGRKWLDDAMQLAHYTRMLQELGFHPLDGLNHGGIIGTSDFAGLTGGRYGITWYDLDAQTIPARTRSDPTRQVTLSPLEHYDAEFAFRLAVARRAAAGGELVRPYRVDECATCEWFSYCADVAGPDDASFAIKTGHLTGEEWRDLYREFGQNGALNIAQLACVNPDEYGARFAERSLSRRNPVGLLANVVRRAQMTVSGEAVMPRDTPPATVPAADIEVDFDIEWDSDGRIYQWGLRIRDGQDDRSARYEPVVSFDPLDDRSEEELAAKFAARITGLRARAQRDGKSVRVFHWHNPEVTRTRKFPAVTAALDGITVDLMEWLNTHYLCRSSSSIKDVAAVFGFTWGVDDPGGLTSVSKIDTARGRGPEAEDARRWCLGYNEGDVAAQAAIRDALRQV